MKLDKTDLLLLRQLLIDGRTSYAELAGVTGLSVPGARDRVKRLESAGVLMGYEAKVSPEKLGFPVRALIYVELSCNGSDVVDSLGEINNVLACSSLAGREDLVLEVRVATTEALLHLSEKVRGIKGVLRTTTSVVLHDYFRQQKLIEER